MRTSDTLLLSISVHEILCSSASMFRVMDTKQLERGDTLDDDCFHSAFIASITSQPPIRPHSYLQNVTIYEVLRRALPENYKVYAHF